VPLTSRTRRLRCAAARIVGLVSRAQAQIVVYVARQTARIAPSELPFALYRLKGKFMKLSALCLTLAFAALPATVCAQTVYKCTGKDGVTIFSSEPCGKDAKATTYQAPTADKEAERADASCRRDANELAYKPNDAAVDAAKAELDALGKSTNRGTPAENEAWKRNVQARMDSLQEYIRHEEERNAAQLTEAVRKRKQAVAECDRQKAERQSQLAADGNAGGA
jgi:hypothetical protein